MDSNKESMSKKDILKLLLKDPSHVITDIQMISSGNADALKDKLDIETYRELADKLKNKE